MKQIYLSAAISCAVGLFSCKKEKTITVTNTVRDTTIITSYLSGQVNPDSLSAGLKVGHGTAVTGTFPEKTSDAEGPAIDSLNKQEYKIVRNRFLVVHPKVLSGNIAGYYIQIAGAGSYFKVDYSQAFNLRSSIRRSGFRTTATANNDSLIVFKLPEGVVGDTFYVKYAAYDDQNRISTAVTERVQILPQGNDTFMDALGKGPWRYLGQRHYSKGQFTDEWSIDTQKVSQYAYYNCVNNKLVSSEEVTDLMLPMLSYREEEKLTFKKYTWTYTYKSYGVALDLDNSSCSNAVFTTYLSDTARTTTYGISYDPNTNILILTEENFDQDLYYDTYYVNEITDKQLILSYPQGDEPEHNNNLRFIKLIQ
jgi:hypothetical protein